MKYSNILTILLFSSALSFYSCNKKTEGTTTEDTKTEGTTTEGTTTESSAILAADTLNATNMPVQPNAATPAEPAQNAAGVWHYTCAKGCAGGAGAAGNCATCGGVLAHNQAYHNNANSMPATNPMTAPATAAPTTTTPNAVTPQPAEPAQNAAGVWHYTCAKGCAGGAGSAGACATCGSTLEHNQAYHK